MTAEGETVLDPISFTIPLKSELDSSHVHVAPNAACTGTAKEPTAAPGNLCVYIGVNVLSDMELNTIYLPNELAEGADTAGAVLKITSTAVPAAIWGTWAVTG